MNGRRASIHIYEWKDLFDWAIIDISVPRRGEKNNVKKGKYPFPTFSFGAFCFPVGKWPSNLYDGECDNYFLLSAEMYFFSLKIYNCCLLSPQIFLSLQGNFSGLSKITRIWEANAGWASEGRKSDCGVLCLHQS